MRCPQCHTTYGEEDLYCRQCSADLVKTSTDIVPSRTNLPSLLYNAPLPRKVAASVGALAVGVGIELLRRNMLARLRPARVAQRALPSVLSLRDVIHPTSEKRVKLPKGYEVHETIVYMQRVIRRED